MLAGHLIAAATAQEPGQFRWQNLRTGRARCQPADLFGTGHRPGLEPNPTVSPAVYLCIAALGVNVLNWHIARVRADLLAWQLRHAGAQAVDVPIGRRKVSQFQALSDSGSPGSSSPGPVRRPPDPGPPRAAGQYGRPGRGGNRRDGGRDRIAGSCCHSRPPVPQCFPRRPPQGPGSRRRTGPRPAQSWQGCPARPDRWILTTPRFTYSVLPADRQTRISDLPGAATIAFPRRWRTVPAYG